MFEVIGDDGDAVTIGGRLPCSPDAAFAAFVDPDLLAQWWQTTATTDPTPGGRYHMAWEGPGWDLRGVYTEVASPHRLAFTWSWDHEDVEAAVTIDLAPGDESTVVTITHTYSGEAERDGYVEGWLHFLPRIAAVV